MTVLVGNLFIGVALNNILEKTINVIMASMSSVQTNVKWNKEMADYFHLHHGLRKEDCISTYLYVLCMDKLSHLISQGVHDEGWKPLRGGMNNHLISHLVFF